MIDKHDLVHLVFNSKGKKRHIYTYPRESSSLKTLHEFYIKFIDSHFIPSKFSHAYTKNRSIYTNSIRHLENDIFIKLDVEDFFTSLNHNYLVEALHYELNKKKPDTISIRECWHMVHNSSINRRGLPLGLLPSPILSNVYMKKFDSVIYGKIKNMDLDNITYTRYADDIFISFRNGDKTTYADKIINLCSNELDRFNLRLNHKKTKVIDLRKSNHVKIAGVNITSSKDRARILTVGRKQTRDLYFRAVEAYTSQSSVNELEVNKIKGMHSFMLSIEKNGYSHRLSKGMTSNIHRLGFSSLEQLISNMDPKILNIDNTK